MKKEGMKKIKQEKYRSEQQEEIIKLVKVLVAVVLVVLIIYLFTRIFITKDLFNSTSENTEVKEGAINYETTIIGQMFNKQEKEYYVAIYDSESNDAMIYSTIISLYQSSENAKKIYLVDLKNETFNKKYYTEDEAEINLNTMDLNKFKVGDLALLKITNNKISKTIQNKDDFAKELTVKK